MLRLERVGNNTHLVSRIKSLAVALLVLAGLQASPVAVMASTDTIKLIAFGNLHYNTNLLRFSSPQEAEKATGNRNTDSFIKQYGAGLNLQLPLGKQELYFNGQMFQSTYSHYGFLDYTGGNAESHLKMEWGRFFRGKVGGDYTRTLSTFEFRPQVQGGEIPKDVRINSRVYAAAQLQFAPEWSLVMGADQRRNDYTLLQQAGLIRDANTSYLEFRLHGNDGNYLGMGYEKAQVSYPQRAFTTQSLIDNEFSDNSLYVATRLNLQPYSVLDGRLAMVQRKHQHLELRDFNTYEAKVSYQHRFANASQATISAWRDLQGTLDVSANFVTKTGGEIKFTIPLTGKIGVATGVTGSLFEFNDTDVASTHRKDGVITANADLSYEATRNVLASVGVSSGYRNSSIDQYDFSYRMLSFKLQGAF